MSTALPILLLLEIPQPPCDTKTKNPPLLPAFLPSFFLSPFCIGEANGNCETEQSLWKKISITVSLTLNQDLCLFPLVNTNSQSTDKPTHTALCL